MANAKLMLPSLGDFADTLLAMWVLSTIMRVGGVPNTLKSKMTFNITIDFIIGLVPVIGDFADAFWRANTKNYALLYQHLATRAAARELERQEMLEKSAIGAPGQVRKPSPSHGNDRITQQPHMQPQAQYPITNVTRPSAPMPADAPPRYATYNDVSNEKSARPTNNKTAKGGWLSRFGGGGGAQTQQSDIELGRGGRL